MSVFGLSFEKLLVIGVIAVFLLGPDRLPGYAAKLAQFVRTLRTMADTAKNRMRDEMGPEFDEVEWQKLDPRQYDPRRIIRDALLDGPEAPAPARGARLGTAAAGAATGASVAGAAGASGSPVRSGIVGLPSSAPPREVVPLAAGEVPPYDSEAT
ncbi:Sec-independent protein translocase family protein [Frigoribacterium salinisoli]